MNTLIILALCAVAVAAGPPYASGADKDAVIVRSDSDVAADQYQYAYETSNGINAQEQGQLVNPGAENEAISARGQYSYTGPDGVQYQVTYIADENGFQPQGAHIPVPPQ